MARIEDSEEINSREAMVRRYSLRYSIKEVPIVFLKYFMKCDWLSPTSAEISVGDLRSNKLIYRCI